MSLVRLYARVLSLLGPQRRLAVALVVANVAIAASQFAEPMLFGRIIDRLTASDSSPESNPWAPLLPLLAAWIAFGLFSIGASVLVALQADRLAHRRRLAVTA